MIKINLLALTLTKWSKLQYLLWPKWLSEFLLMIQYFWYNLDSIAMTKAFRLVPIHSGTAVGTAYVIVMGNQWINLHKGNAFPAQGTFYFWRRVDMWFYYIYLTSYLTFLCRMMPVHSLPLEDCYRGRTFINGLLIMLVSSVFSS